VTAFASVLGVDIDAGAELALREATDGAAPTGPNRLILFKVTDAPTTHEKLTAAGYDVTLGRRLFMDAEETLVTDDPGAVSDRDYYTLAYAEKWGRSGPSATRTLSVVWFGSARGGFGP